MLAGDGGDLGITGVQAGKLAGEAFAKAHGLGPGDTIAAVINGRRQELEIVGLALSPEYVYQIRPGELLPDDKRFGVLWMERRALATAFDMEGGFNDVVLKLMHGAQEREVISRLDDLIEAIGLPHEKLCTYCWSGKDPSC